MKKIAFPLFVAFACHTSPQGPIPEPPVLEEPPDPQPQPDPNIDDDSLVFDDTFVHEVAIEVEESRLAELQLSSDVWVPGGFTFDGISLLEVGIRLKGHLGSGREMSDKASFSVKFAEFLPEQRLHGLKRLLLNNEVQDPGLTSRRLGYEIWRRAGVPAPRTAYARVTVNGEYFGFYTIEEAYGAKLLKRWFEDASGNLYEGSGKDVSDVWGMDLDTNEEQNDRSDLQGLALALNEPDEVLLSALEEHLDLEQFYTYWAVERLVYQWDGYGTVKEDLCCSPNNYYIYHDPSQGRFVFLPRGADGLFRLSSADVGLLPREKSKLASRLFSLPEVRARLAQEMLEILATAWDVPSLQAYLDSTGVLILENFTDGAREETSLERISRYLERYHMFLEERPALVRARLEQGL